MADLLSGTAVFEDFTDAVSVHLVDVSPKLREAQREKLRCDPKVAETGTNARGETPTPRRRTTSATARVLADIRMKNPLARETGTRARTTPRARTRRRLDARRFGGGTRGPRRERAQRSTRRVARDHRRGTPRGRPSSSRTNSSTPCPRISSPARNAGGASDWWPSPRRRGAKERENGSDASDASDASSSPGLRTGAVARAHPRGSVDDSSSPGTRAEGAEGGSASIGDQSEDARRLGEGRRSSRRRTAAPRWRSITARRTDRGPLRAIKNHEFVDVLRDPGSADLSVYVDFGAMREVIENRDAGGGG